MFNPVIWFTTIPAEWAIFLLSMFPLTELRAAIPIGIEAYHLAIWKVWFIAVFGNFIPPLIILYLIPKLHEWILRQKFIGSLLKKKLEQAGKAFSGTNAKYGALGLIIFIGIPLPLTGAWTGALVAFIFNIPFKKSWWMILAGICIAATLTTLITLFAGGTLRAIF